MTEASSLQPSPLRRRLLWGGVMVFLLLALILTPPLLNVSRLQRRISASISASLGRPVRMEGVQLHLLPMPGFTVNYIVVNEDPAFGNEPVIRADQVIAQLRVSSLWRRQVEFSRIEFRNPSLNLVRNAAGRWNLEDILSHAAQVDAAPTAQKTASEQPRFPYIEATGARVNFKLGDEKLPFSLDAADLALWLPTAQQWRVRVEAKPLRTDAPVGNVGTMRLEAGFERAASLALVPVDLKASWHEAPLGEASRLLTGDDAGWRGTLHLDTTLTGRLGSGTLRTRLTLDGLRRADFVPAQMLDVSTSCETLINIPELKLANSTCLVGDGDPEPLAFRAAAVDLEDLDHAAFSVEDTKLALPAVFTWLRLLSPRIPPLKSPDGTVAVHLARGADRLWTGTAAVSLPAASEEAAQPAEFVFRAGRNPASGEDAACVNALVLAPTMTHFDKDSAAALSGSLSACGLTLRLNGTASTPALDAATASLPMLGDALQPLLPESHTAAPVDVTCTHAWFAPQTCTANHAAPAATKPARRR